MRRILCMLLAMLMLFGLCACGRSAAPAADNAAPAEAGAQEEAEKAPEEVAEEAADVEYSVSVTDTEGNPIPGVKLQFCDETACTLGDTDADGAAVFTAKEGSFTIKVLEVPFGFVGTDEEFSFPGTDREIGIALEILKPTVDEPAAGFSFYDPEKYGDIKGIIDWDVYPLSDHIYFLEPIYYAVSKDDAARFEELLDDPKDAALSMFDVVCVLEDESEAEDYLKSRVRPSSGWDAVSLEKIGSAKNVTCFLIEIKLSEKEEERLKAGMGEFYAEFAALCEDKETFISGIRLQKPRGETLLFEAKDLNGNPVDLAEVFAGHKVTMVDVWETGCVPCKEELPRLEELNKQFEERDCQIIGICIASLAEDDIAKAKSILENAGVTYLNVYAQAFDHELLDVPGFPTAYFVDSEGYVLTEPLIGAFTEKYFWSENTKALEAALSRVGD